MEDEKICFVIAPIGEEGTEIRKRSEQILKHVIEPIVSKHGYRAMMAHQMAKPGIITTQIVDEILNAPLVIADLSGHNANVLYELAIRHVVKKPVVQLIQKGESLPFDISQQRTIPIDHRDLDSVESAKEELSKQIESVLKDPTQVDSPISVALDMRTLRTSAKPVESALVEILSLLQEVKNDQKRFLTEPGLRSFINRLLNAKPLDSDLVAELRNDLMEVRYRLHEDEDTAISLLGKMERQLRESGSEPS